MERDKKIDLLKGIAIYLVVMGHVIAWFFEDFSENRSALPTNVTALWTLIYSFHMPLFVFLSGYVFMNPLKQYDFVQILKRCLTYMIPFATMGLLLYCWRGGKIDNYWYFRSLSEFSLLLFAIYKCVYKIKKPLKIFTPPYIHILTCLVFLGIIFVLSYVVKGNVLLNILFDSSHLMLGFYFALGWMYRRYKVVIDKVLINQWILLGSGLSVFVSVVYNINIPYLRAGVTLLFALNIVQILADGFNCKHLEEIGKETKGIYILHFFFTCKLFVIGKFLCDISGQGLSTNIVVQFVIVSLVSYMIIKCCKYIIKFIKASRIIALVCLGQLK